MEYVSAAGNYQLTFEGATTDDDISGNVNGKVVASTLTGSWTANGKDQKFRAAVKTNIQEPDILAKKFVEGLNKAESYKGDEKNLYIYYQSGQQTLCLVFHAL